MSPQWSLTFLGSVDSFVVNSVMLQNLLTGKLHTQAKVYIQFQEIHAHLNLLNSNYRKLIELEFGRGECFGFFFNLVPK